MGFFEGVAQRNSCACGFWIAMTADLSYTVYWNSGGGTNTKVEALTLWGLLWFNSVLGNLILHIYGDSKIIIDQVMGRASINNPMLQGSP